MTNLSEINTGKFSPDAVRRAEQYPGLVLLQMGTYEDLRQYILSEDSSASADDRQTDREVYSEEIGVAPEDADEYEVFVRQHLQLHKAASVNGLQQTLSA